MSNFYNYDFAERYRIPVHALLVLSIIIIISTCT